MDLKKYQINKTDEILEKLAKQGEVIILNRPENYAKQKEMNKINEEARRDYIVMNALSEQSARKVILYGYSSI